MTDGKHFTTLEKEGDDLLATIPQEILDKVGLKIGDPVDITVENGKIIVTPTKD